MIDRELLEMAAKAAGMKILGWLDGVPDVGCARNIVWWNPLTDDGDALRLVVMLGIEIKFNYGIVSDTAEVRYPHGDHGGIKAVFESLDNDPYAATRRAIVRAASEIGKNMKC